MDDTKRKLMAIAGERLPPESLCSWQVRSAREADRAAIKEVTAWRKIWGKYVKEHLTELLLQLDHADWYKNHPRIAFDSLTMFNTTGATNNNPFHVPFRPKFFPVRSEAVKEIYIGEWKRYWFNSATRFRILQEALDRESARKRARSRRVGVITRNEIYVLKKGRCGICGRLVPRKKFHIDEIQPLSRGGKRVIGNIQLAHPSCNASKCNRIFASSWVSRQSRRRLAAGQRGRDSEDIEGGR